MPKPDLIPARGAVAEPLLLEVDRALTAEDLTRLVGAPKVTVPILQKLRATHHRQAQLLASGKSVKEVAAIVGCTTQRLVQLQVDPTFRELMNYYRDQIMTTLLEDNVRLQHKIIDLGEMAVDELTSRLEDDGRRTTMPVGEVRKIAEFSMDRTVAPPKVAAPPTHAPAAITINFGTPVGKPQVEQEAKLTIEHAPSPQGETDVIHHSPRETVVTETTVTVETATTIESSEDLL